MGMITELDTTADFDAHISTLPPSTLLILYFHTRWAAPCVQMTADLEMLASSYPVHNPPLISWVRVDADKLLNVTEAYNVTAVPFIVLAKGGKVLHTVRGCDAIKVGEAVEEHAGNRLIHQLMTRPTLTNCIDVYSVKGWQHAERR